MKRAVTTIGVCLGILLLFVGGVFLGAYYQPELAVFSRALGRPDVAPAVIPTTDDASGQSQSFLIVPAFEQTLPLVFSDSLDEERIQEDLKRGASVLPLGTTFGEPGNVVITAHSSGSFGFGPYRFAFARLNDLELGQEFQIKTGKAVYTYTVYGRDIVWPHEVDRLPKGDKATVTLVTCWPKWTSLKRLLVHAELTKTEGIE